MTIEEKIAAIKTYRNTHRCSLVSAKNAIEHPGEPQCSHGHLEAEGCVYCENEYLRGLISASDIATGD